MMNGRMYGFLEAPCGAPSVVWWVATTRSEGSRLTSAQTSNFVFDSLCLTHDKGFYEDKVGDYFAMTADDPPHYIKERAND